MNMTQSSGVRMKPMFNRKNSDEVEQGGATRVAVAEPARAPALPRPEPARRPIETHATTGVARGTGNGGAGEGKKLIVGPEISLHGHIAFCDRLVVEGTVEAELTDCHTIEIMRAGVFSGAAEIESAEISGRYEGSLTVRGHLLIHGTGSVSGTIRYGRLEIQPGGVVNGDIKMIEAKAQAVAGRIEAPPEPERATPLTLASAS